MILDIECYKNYFMALFYEPGQTPIIFERGLGRDFDSDDLLNVLNANEIVTFNGNNYDIPVLSAAYQGFPCEVLKHITDQIIKHDVKGWQVARQVRFQILRFNHIDLIEVAPGMASLKIYGGRLHSKKLQDLPIDPEEEITEDQIPLLQKYCLNDCTTTHDLYVKLAPQLDLRRQMSEKYGMDLMSKSDAQIAEAVITSEVSKRLGRPVVRPKIQAYSFNYVAPTFIEFTTPLLRDLIQTVEALPFIVEKSGTIKMPKTLEEMQITLGGSTYQMGMGGLHSTEKSRSVEVNGYSLLIEFDVSSYYPSIILNCGLAPEHMGEAFLEVYEAIVKERLEAKKSGDKVKADSYKILINGSFGKLGSCYSTLYSPKLLIQVTLTGQLALLMLIEELESNGISVISANTDGIVIHCDKAQEEFVIEVTDWWQDATGFVLERADYAGVFSRDVNNYVAITTGGKVKSKGAYAQTGIQKNAQNEICVEALTAYLKDGILPEETIRGCKDIRKFVTIRTVKGGAVKGDLLLGKAVRWYYNGCEGTINYRTNGNKVPLSEGAQPLMDLPDELPKDIDYNWYENEVNEMLMDIGLIPRPPKERKTRCKKVK